MIEDKTVGKRLYYGGNDNVSAAAELEDKFDRDRE